jgi:WAS/WASL-interacting protein
MPFGARPAGLWGRSLASLWTNYLGYLYATTPVPEIGAPASSAPASSAPPAPPRPAPSRPAPLPQALPLPAPSRQAPLPRNPPPRAEAPSAPELSFCPRRAGGARFDSSDPVQSQQSSLPAKTVPLSPPQDAPESGALGWVAAAVSLLSLPAVGAAVLATAKAGQRLRIFGARQGRMA